MVRKSFVNKLPVDLSKPEPVCDTAIHRVDSVIVIYLLEVKERVTEKNMPYYAEIAYNANPDFPSRLREALLAHKVVYLRDTLKLEKAALLPWYSELCQNVGTLSLHNEDAFAHTFDQDDWFDIRYDAVRAQSFRYSNTRQPLHTDSSYEPFHYECALLCCERPADFGGATTFIDADLLVEALAAWSPSLLESLRNTPIIFAKGEYKVTDRPVIDEDKQGLLLNWNYFPMSPENPPEWRAVGEAFHQFLEERVVQGGLLTSVALRTGEAVFFKDRRVLHGRNSFIGDRCIYKGMVDL